MIFLHDEISKLCYAHHRFIIYLLGSHCMYIDHILGIVCAHSDLSIYEVHLALKHNSNFLN